MIDVKELPDDVQELKNIIIDLQNEKDNYEKKINALLEDIELWKSVHSSFHNQTIMAFGFTSILPCGGLR